MWKKTCCFAGLVCSACATVPVDTNYIHVVPVRLNLTGVVEPLGWIEVPLCEATALRVQMGDVRYQALTGNAPSQTNLDQKSLQKLLDVAVKEVEATGYCKKGVIPSMGRRIVRTLGAHENWIYVECDPPLRPLWY